jgi:hypothetical protein
MESSTRGDVAPGLAPDNGKTPADEVAEAGEVHSAHALGSTTTPHSKREKAALQLVATNSMGSAANSMGKTPGGSGGEEGESDEGAGSMRSTRGVEAQRTAVGKRRAWQEHVAEALPWVLSTNSMGSLPAADAGAARAAGSEDEAAGHARPADEPTPERGAQAKRARGGSGEGDAGIEGA